MVSFRFNAQTVYLTYSQTKQRMTPAWLLMQIATKAEVTEHLICQEQHKDGGYHLHAYFKFAKKLDTKSSKFFDIKYYSSYHPNIQRVKKKWLLFKYIKKDGEYITNIETRPFWLEVLEDSESNIEFLKRLMWKIGRIDNYAGYKTLTELWEQKHQIFKMQDPISS